MCLPIVRNSTARPRQGAVALRFPCGAMEEPGPEGGTSSPCLSSQELRKGRKASLDMCRQVGPCFVCIDTPDMVPRPLRQEVRPIFAPLRGDQKWLSRSWAHRLTQHLIKGPPQTSQPPGSSPPLLRSSQLSTAPTNTTGDPYGPPLLITLHPAVPVTQPQTWCRAMVMLPPPGQDWVSKGGGRAERDGSEGDGADRVRR